MTNFGDIKFESFGIKNGQSTFEMERRKLTQVPFVGKIIKGGLKNPLSIIVKNPNGHEEEIKGMIKDSGEFELSYKVGGDVESPTGTYTAIAKYLADTEHKISSLPVTFDVKLRQL